MNDHPNLASIETERQTIFAKLEAAQDTYHTANTHYLQGLVTPATAQDGTSLSSFDRERKPSDEKDDWSTLLTPTDVASGTRCQYYVHRYDGPAGPGFILGCQVVYDSVTWRYEEHHGPETSRSGPFNEWYEVTDGQ
jgi:hypothetical protein